MVAKLFLPFAQLIRYVIKLTFTLFLIFIFLSFLRISTPNYERGGLQLTNELYKDKGDQQKLRVEKEKDFLSRIDWSFLKVNLFFSIRDSKIT